MRTGRNLKRAFIGAAACVLVLAVREPSLASPNAGAQLGFVRGGSVYLASGDGRHAHVVVHRKRDRSGSETYLDPSWSRTGRLAVTVLFQPNEGNEDSHVDVIRPGRRPIHVPSGGYSCCDGKPTWSPDGQRIALIGFNYGEGGTLYITRVGSKTSAAVRRNASSEDVENEPAWSPDGRAIAYVKFTDTHSQLLTVSPDGRNLTRLVARSAHNPSWSPNGRLIAFDDGGQVFVVNPDGARVRRLTSGEGGTDPAWSPDGHQIAFVRGGSIWLMDASGGDVRRVVANATQPSWKR
jgi:Tol biopolymer transport system component